ncbi:MAG: 2Fe-2S iron-sulfur cluster binding domain-containing protein [Planctomycetales bacterium]|nr:2Fe-2S iron-sulfur cluster binding domain-containing protein [Planctomycetales bacterium]
MIDPSAIAYSAFSLIAFSFVKLGTSGFRASQSKRRCHLHRTERLQIRRSSAEVARLNSQLNCDGSKSSWRVLEVAEVVQESEDCRSFYLVDPYGQPLPDFFPGQYLMVRPAVAGAYQVTRCYSLSSPPDGRYWRITVKRQESTQGLSPMTRNKGGLSCWLHDKIGKGDCLLVGGPNGHFFLRPDNHRKLVLIAAGVGITPMCSMLEWSIRHNVSREVRLVYQVKDPQHWPLGRQLHQLQSKHATVQVHTFVSRTNENELHRLRATHAGYFHAGKFDGKYLSQVFPDNDCDYFMCGPDAWMQAMRDGLVSCGISERNIHWESFGGASPNTSSPGDGTHKSLSVEFRCSGVTAQSAEDGQSLWELAKENEVEIASGCLSGVCGCCRTKILEGSVVYDRPIALELAKDECLACVARPATALVLDV